MVDQHWQFNDAEAALRTRNMDNRTWVPLPLVLDKSVKPNYSMKPAFNSGGGLGISVSCKDVDGALKVINDLLSNDVIILRNWGEKDIDYKIDDNGLFYKTDIKHRYNSDKAMIILNY